MTIPANIPSQEQSPNDLLPMELESQQQPVTVQLPADDASTPASDSTCPLDSSLDTEIHKTAPNPSSSESLGLDAGGDEDAHHGALTNEKNTSLDDNATLGGGMNITMSTVAAEEPSTEVVYLEKPTSRRSITFVNIVLAILLPLAFALIVALIAVSQKQRTRTTTSAASSYVLTGEITCGCTTCSQQVLGSVTQEGTTCLQEITSLMSQLALDESQACMLVGQQFPDTCGDCDASICNRRVGTCGCPSTCTDALLATTVADDAGAYSCKARMQFIMDTKGVDEADACDFVSDEFPDVCGTGCKASECQALPDNDAEGFNYRTDDGLGEGTASSTSSDVCPKLVWQDEFNGETLDTDAWNYQLGDGCDIGLCQWGNAELQSYQSENAYLSNGKLIIEARNDNGVYTSARLISKGLLDFRYGYVESSIQIPSGNGMWPAFWALPTDSVFGKWPQSGEIDVMENVGREPDAIHGTIHYGDPWPDNSNTGKRIQLPDSEAFSSRFHNFAVFWEKDRIRWFLNGAQYSEKTPDDTDPKNWPFNNRFYLLLNVAIGGNWPGSPDSSTVFPQQMKVDYVRIYDKPYGRLVGPTVVNETQQDVQFTLESGLSDYTYKWTVPSGASITSSNPTGSSTITVAFGGQSGYVTVVATSSKCSSSKTFSMPVLVGAEYQYVPGAKVKDCGCPDTCSSSALERMASDAVGEYSCRERINWVMKNQYLVEKEACQIVYDEFPSICTCDPSNCT